VRLPGAKSKGKGKQKARKKRVEKLIFVVWQWFASCEEPLSIAPFLSKVCSFALRQVVAQHNAPAYWYGPGLRLKMGPNPKGKDHLPTMNFRCYC